MMQGAGQFTADHIHMTEIEMGERQQVGIANLCR